MSGTLTIMHIFIELSGQFGVHRANYKERKGNGRTSHQKDGREKKVLVLSARPTGCCCLVTRNKYLSLYIYMFTQGMFNGLILVFKVLIAVQETPPPAQK